MHISHMQKQPPPPSTGVPPKPKENGRHGTLQNGRPPLNHKPRVRNERGGKRITAAILADVQGEEGGGKDEGSRTGVPQCEHLPTENSSTCGVN